MRQGNSHHSPLLSATRSLRMRQSSDRRQDRRRARSYGAVPAKGPRYLHPPAHSTAPNVSHRREVFRSSPIYPEEGHSIDLGENNARTISATRQGGALASIRTARAERGFSEDREEPVSREDASSPLETGLGRCLIRVRAANGVFARRGWICPIRRASGQRDHEWPDLRQCDQRGKSWRDTC